MADSEVDCPHRNPYDDGYERIAGWTCAIDDNECLSDGEICQKRYKAENARLLSELEATRKAKAENDERFQTERDDARQENARLRSAVGWQAATITTRDARIVELEEGLRDVIGSYGPMYRDLDGPKAVLNFERSIRKARALLPAEMDAPEGIERELGEMVAVGESKPKVQTFPFDDGAGAD